MYNSNRILNEHIRRLKATGVIRYNADIVRDTGVNKGVLSTYISGKVEPSKQFLKKFNEAYKLSLQNIEVAETVSTFQESKEKYIAQGYSPTMPGFNESQKATAITTDLGLSSAVLLLVSELVAKMTGEPLEEVVKRANQLAKEGAKKSESALRHDVVIDSLVS